jgi:aminoglycoside 6'-N-acetyltransferase
VPGNPRPPRRLRGERVVLRRATEVDLPAVASVLADPEVVRWWGPLDRVELGRDLRRRDPVMFVIEVDGDPAGMVQYHEEVDPMYRHAGIDIALASAWQGLGLGTDALNAVIRYLFEERGHHRLTIDPALKNERAIASYRKVGFKPVGVLRSYERGIDGSWHDNLLMELLKEDFAAGPPKAAPATLLGDGPRK